MEFDWMTPKKPASSSASSEKRAEMYRREVVYRAGIFYRLGYTQDQATARLRQNAAWDFEPGDERAPLSDEDIEKLVESTYTRRSASL